MEVKTIRDEVINLRLVRQYTLKGNILTIKDAGKYEVFTLTDESKDRLVAYLEEHVT